MTDLFPLSFVMNAQDCEEGRVLHQVQPDRAPQDVWWETGGEPEPLPCARSRHEVEWFDIVSVPPTRGPAPVVHPHIVGAERASTRLSEMASYGCVHTSLGFCFPAVMQRAEVREKLHVLLADFQKITRRTDREGQEFVRTYVPTAGVCRLGTRPQHRLSQCRAMRSTETKQTGHAGWACWHTGCVPSERQLFSVQAQPKTVSFW